MPTKLVCGCGYLGERVARRWLAGGDEVWVTTRSIARSESLRQSGYHPLVVDVTRPFSLPEKITQFDTVLSAVGFDRSAGHSIREVYVRGLSHLLGALAAEPQRLIYISSTGVYGQSHGEWIDEQSPCQPNRSGGQACLDAELLLAQHSIGARSIVLRLAGIYGPGRIPKLAAVRAGEAIASPANGYLNLIHVDDAVEVVLAVDNQIFPPARFVVSDGQPVVRGEFYGELARLLNAPVPRFTEATGSSITAERTLSDKRVCSDLLRSTLQLSPRYPSYREGLAAIVAELR